MIGKFDSQTVEEHESRFKNGKMPLSDAKVSKKDIVFDEIDCASLAQDTGLEKDEDFDEILAEILAEEEERRRQQEEEEGTTTKKKKAGGKKKKKKAASAKRDEL